VTVAGLPDRLWRDRALALRAARAGAGDGIRLRARLRGAPGAGYVAGTGSVGEFFWGAVTGTYFWIDPQKHMVVVLMVQAPDQRLHYR